MPDSTFPLIHPADAHPDLERWRENVGAAVSLDLAEPPEAEAGVVEVLSWNVAIGQGRLGEVLARLLDGRLGDVARDSDTPLVALIQEAYRADETVPESPLTRHHGGKAAGAARADCTDVITVARALGLSLRYAPSMRNGRHPSDRGNAILSTLPLEDAAGLRLPHVRQRRVAVAARVPALSDLVVVSAHLDTRGSPRPVPGRGDFAHGRGAFGAGRAAQATHLGERLVERHGEDDVLLGADLNSPFGRRDPAVRALRAAGFEHAERAGAWRYTMRAPLRLELDHVMLRSGASRVRRCEVHRLDDGDGSVRRCFGSDHHPLLVRVRY